MGKKCKNLLLPAMLLFFVYMTTSAVFAFDVKVTVIDSDIDFPLEGVVLRVSGSEEVFETDFDGVAVVTIPDDGSAVSIMASYPGYDERKMLIPAGSDSIEIQMHIADVLEGKELVVERSVPGKSDEESGVSVVMEKAEMKTISEIGLVEDVMSAINTLPGITYSGDFYSQPSIRGGYPDEMQSVMDGIYIIYPWHWGGAYSIFNPAMVSSAKMSHGIFSARYGRAMSGLLEVTTKTPESSQVRFSAGVSTISTDVFAEIPFTPKTGLLIGGKVTYLDLLQLGYDAIGATEVPLKETIPVMPYIRDGYAKWYWNPFQNFNITWNAFYGSDGVGVAGSDTSDGATSESSFNWEGISIFTGLNINYLATEKLRFHSILSYNRFDEDTSLNSSSSGVFKYNDDFISTWDGTFFDSDGLKNGKINGATTYKLEDFTTKLKSVDTIEQYQASLESDVQITSSNSISFGADAIFGLTKMDQHMSAWQEIIYNNTPVMQKTDYELCLEGNKTLESSAFALWNFGTEASVFQGELGVRADHVYLWNNDNDLSINTYPVFNPRLSVRSTPWRNKGILDKVTFSLGTGCFSCISTETKAAKPEFNIKDFEVVPNHVWFTVGGVNLDIVNDITFTVEGYYKHYLNRFYIVVNDKNPEDVKYEVRTNGQGYSTGFDLMLQKKNGKKFDGYLTYSFVYAKFLNPYTPDYDNQLTNDGDPLNEWFYPSFHRFHTMNLILNWKPVTGWVFTVKAALATGKPEKENGKITSYPVTILNDDGTTTVMQRYTRSSFYSDVLRTDISCPVDVRISYGNYYRNSKVHWEWYVGVEDVFVNLYSPKTSKSFNATTGEESAVAQEADFSIGLPIPSIGVKINY